MKAKKLIKLIEGNGERVTEFEVVDHGMENSQYFQGHGVAYTDWKITFTGAGMTPLEAFNDAAEQLFMSEYEVSPEMSKALDKKEEEIKREAGDVFVGVALYIRGDIENGKVVKAIIADIYAHLVEDDDNNSLDVEDGKLSYDYIGAGAQDAVERFQERCEEQSLDCSAVIDELEKEAQDSDESSEHYYYISIDVK